MSVRSLTRSGLVNFVETRSMLVGNDAFLQSEFELISTAYGTGSSGTISFISSGTWSDYKHLQLRMVVGNTSGGAQNTLIRLGSGSIDSGSNYRSHFLFGDGSTVGSGDYGSATGMYIGNSFNSTTQPAVIITDILDFASSSKNTTIRSMHGYANASRVVQLLSGVWLNTSAVDRLDIYNATFTSTSRFSLYGIRG